MFSLCDQDHLFFTKDLHAVGNRVFCERVHGLVRIDDGSGGTDQGGFDLFGKIRFILSKPVPFNDGQTWDPKFFAVSLDRVQPFPFTRESNHELSQRVIGKLEKLCEVSIDFIAAHGKLRLDLPVVALKSRVHDAAVGLGDAE